mmetsp:Transcript_5455/g.13291  ORF Transcript_5455/g.13291 Transcript_5455/m.13291 type:complete len:254 (-) Transcript_5455:212-973(-)|eukprot:CAMPEP_0114526202 /NCGR_PEP_ID=MMETSP0109-20121206/22879_1 /TAXON_ID=29199 /ORGANISM="Chlorarachnion reptans, Strain CCCM449" /LENGTH=253 /DNA_ID=CAMNT_0001707929 /DNA_START=141 /DNA_END=902 /DNA_ORIENTATION=+
MARNQEKAQAMLNRFLAFKKESMYGARGKRPALASECRDLLTAERWRRSIVREISKHVTEIQNGSLGEHRVRDLNDHINKQLRVKHHWEKQIKMLGGPDYTRGVPDIRDGRQGRPIGSNGYFYFGAARNLPGVRELFEKQAYDKISKKTRGELHKLVDAQYYGYGDDDDGILAKVEKKVEQKARKRAIKKWNEENKKVKVRKVAKTYDGSSATTKDKDGEVLFKAHVPLPSDEDIKAAILAKKKAELMAKYAN